MRLWWLNPLQWNFGPRTTATLLTWAVGPLLVAGGVAWWTITSGAEAGVLAPEQVQYLQVTLLRNAAIVTVPMLAVCIGAAVLFSSVVVRPLKALLRAMEQMAGGNLAQEPVPVRSRDEVGQATRSFNRMAESLRNMVRTVASTVEDLEGAGGRLQACAGTTRSATEATTAQIEQVRATAVSQTDQAAGGARATAEMRSAAEQVATSADAQAKEVERVALTVRQVAQAIEQVAESAGVVADAAANTRLAADDGNRAVTDVVAGMDRVRDRVLNAAGQIEGLAQSLSHVDEILQLISEIADQTDLLALNAAIEAARVGEHGRGFAVVAGEVRRLAERSRRAAGDIADRISTLRAGAEDVVVTMQAGTQEVHTGAELAREAGSSLDRIMVAVTETQRQVESISAAAEEISAAGAQVVEVTHHLSAIAEENAATASQMLGSAHSVADMVATVEAGARSNQVSSGALAEASGKVRMTVEEMVACATQVSATSTKLREHVAQFRLK